MPDMLLDDGPTDATSRILAFLKGIGIPVIIEASPANAVLPNMAVRNGALVVDLNGLRYPGDMLHEAGHIAVTDSALRSTLCEVSSDPAEEMATIAWSYAAALAAGIDPALVFHEVGYAKSQGNYVGGDYLVQAFATGATMGQPMLHFWGMCTDGNIDPAATEPVFPQMKRWLR